MSKSIKAVAKIVTAPIKAMYDPVGAFKDVFGGVKDIFAGLTGAGKVASGPSSEPSSQTVRSSKAPVRFILGHTSTGGVLAWVQEQPGGQTTGEWLHIVYVLSEGAIAGVDEIYVDEQPIASLGALATYEVVINPTAPNEFLRKNCPDWRAEQIGRNLSFVRVSFLYNSEKFPSGIPDVRFVVRGRSDIYDPRDGQSRYSDNTALLILWYLRNRCGIPDDEIIFETFANAANISDELVTDPQGKRTARYFAGAVIGADEKRNSVLENLLAACAGTLIRVGGRWSLQVGAYYGPADFVITEDMVIGTVEGTTEVSNSDAINTVRGTFIDPSQAWADTDYPEVAVQDWVTQDGGELAESQSFSYVTDAYLAQRLANITLRRRRSGGTVSMPLNFNGYNCRPGRAVRVNLPSLNILGEFIVTDWGMGAMDACKVTLKPYEQAIFDDAVGQPYNPLGFINLPVGGLAAVTNLAWTPATASEVVQGILSWTPPTQTVLSYTVVIRQGGVVVQALKVGGEASTCNVNGLNSGVYALSVICYGPGTVSGEATINVSVDVPPMPESCLVSASVNTITLTPRNSKGLNGGTYEYFFVSREGAPVSEAVYLGQGMSFTHTGLAFAKSYFYYVRSANAYGKSLFLFVKAATSSDAREILDVIKGEVLESDLGKQLTSKIEKIALIDGNGPGSVNERVTTASNTIKADVSKQLIQVNSTIDGVRSNLQGQVTAVEGRMTTARDDLQRQISEVSSIAGALPYNKTKTYALDQAVLGANGKLYQAKKAVPVNVAPPNTDYWEDVGQSVRTANGTASTVSKLQTDVTTLGDTVTATSGKVDGFQASINTANNNASAAQGAAQAANDLAGGKGKVIVQNAAPAVADRLPQNLWIDTTNSANTPKRWNGSAWVSVSDKVATDAAAAAQSALNQVGSKADASAVNSLKLTVDQQGRDLTSQGTTLNGMQTAIDGKASSQALTQVTSRVKLTEDKNNEQDNTLRSQSESLTTLKDTVAKKAEASTVSQLANKVELQGQNVSAHGQALTRIDTSLGKLGASGVNLVPADFSVFTKDLPAGIYSNGGVTLSTVVDASCFKGYALKADNSNENSHTFGLATAFTAAACNMAFKPGKYLVSFRARAQTAGHVIGCYTRVLLADGVSFKTSAAPLFTLTTAWARYSALIDLTAADYDGTQMQLAVQSNRSGIPNRITYYDQFMLEAVVNDQSEPSIFNLGDSFEQATANAVATTALSARVEKTEQGQTSTSQQVTQLENTLRSLDSKVGGKADAAAMQVLANTVEQQGKGITANSQSLTKVSASLSNLGASGVNLIPAEYCAFTKDLPVNMYSNGGVNVSTVADAQALKGYALKADSRSVDSHTFGLNTGFTAASCNMGFKPGKYLVSFYARAETAGHMVGVYARVLLADGSNFKTSNAPTFALTRSWARYAGVIDLTDASAYTGTQMQLAVQSNRSEVANRITYFDRFMLEAVVNDQAEPSNFSLGNSFDQSAVIAEATSALSGRVGKTEEGLTSSSSQLTQLKNSIGGSGVNLLPAEYSAFQKTLPVMDGSSFAASVESDAASFSGGALKFIWTNDSVGLSAFLSPKWNVGNMGMKPQKYIISYRARASANGHVVALYLRGINPDGGVANSPGATQQPLSTSWTRYSYVADLTGDAFTGDKMLLVLQMNRSGVPGRSVWFDQIMVEQMVGEGTAPSTFVPGNTADQSSAAASAVESLNSAVSQQGSKLDSTTSRTTALENTVNSTLNGLPSKASTAAMNTLSGRVTATEEGLTATGNSLTRLNSQIDAIGGAGSNLIPAEFTTFGATQPDLYKLAAMQVTTEADTAAYSGYLLKAAVSGSAATGFMYLASSIADYNLRLKPKATYTFSVWAKGSSAHVVGVRLRFVNSAGTVTEAVVGTVSVTTTLTRQSVVITAPTNLVSTACLVLFTQNTAAVGTTWFDGFMLEAQVGTSAEPSAFVPGPSNRQVAAQATALESLDTKVTQQGTALTAETKRINGLYTSVGDNSSAIQDEATTRTNADSALSTRINTAQAKANEAASAVQNEVTARANADGALSKRIDTAQATAGSASSAVQQVAIAQANLKGELNAQYTVRVQVDRQGGYYKFAGFGIGVTEQGGVAQSAFVVNADQFVLLNGNGNALSAPFAVSGGQTFVADAYIRDASITTAKIADASINSAKIADASISSAKIGVAEVDTLRVAGNAITVPISYRVDGEVRGAGRFQWMDILNISLPMEQAGFVFILFNCGQNYTSGARANGFILTINGVQLMAPSGQAATPAPIVSGSIGVGPGVHNIKVQWYGDDASVFLDQRNIFVMGTKR